MENNHPFHFRKFLISVLIVLLSIPGLVLFPFLVLSCTIGFCFVNGRFAVDAFKDDRDQGLVQGGIAEVESLYQRELREGRLIGAAVGYLVGSLGSGVVLLGLWIYQKWGVYSSYEQMLILTAFAVFGAGFFLFKFREWDRSLYGLTEVFCGMFVPAYKLFSNHSMAIEVGLETLNFDFYIFALTAGVYLVVRGLDNINQGQKSKRSSKISSSE